MAVLRDGRRAGVRGEIFKVRGMLLRLLDQAR